MANKPAPEKNIFALLPTGHVVRARSLDALPEDAVAWCREGDTKWTRLNHQSTPADVDSGPPPVEDQGLCNAIKLHAFAGPFLQLGEVKEFIGI